MCAREEERDWNPLRRIAVMVAARVVVVRVLRVVELEIEFERRGHPFRGADDEVVEVGADAIRADDVERIRLALEVVAVTPDHVDVELRLNTLQRHGWNCLLYTSDA